LFAILIQVAFDYPFSIMVSLVNSILHLVSEFVLDWFLVFFNQLQVAVKKGQKWLEMV